MEKAMKKAKNLLILASCLLAASLLTSCESDDGGGGGDHPYQGSYAGTYSGGYAGTWQVTVHGDGAVTGVAHNTAEGLDYGAQGTVTEGGAMVVAVGEGDLGVTWNAQIDAAGRVTGTWRQAWSGMSGSLSGTR